MSIPARKSAQRALAGLRTRSSSASISLSKAIKPSTKPNQNSSNSSNQNSNETDLTSVYNYVFDSVAKERTTVSPLSLEQNRLSKALQSFNKGIKSGAAPKAANSSASSGKVPWLGIGASTLDNSAPSFTDDASKIASKNEDTPSKVPDLPTLPKEFTKESNSLVPNPDNVELTDQEFKVIWYTNALRQEAGKDPLIVKQSLVNTSRLTSKIMDAKNLLRHRETSGWDGENIAKGQLSAKQVVETWKNSPSHYKNIMGDFKYIGAGDTIEGEGTTFWTQQFGFA